jgi:hypothetical protein
MSGSKFQLMILLAGWFLSSCGMGGSESGNIPDVAAIRTQAVSTFASSLTRTMIPIPSASLTLTSLPTFTPSTVTSTPAATATLNPCYKLIWLKDRTIPDGTHMNANDAFTKKWLVQNNGGCAWAPGFSLRNVGGDSMHGKPLIINQPILVGAKYELSIDLVVPSGQTGLIQSSWRMSDAHENFFGDTLSVNITVGDITTPAITQSP